MSTRTTRHLLRLLITITGLSAAGFSQAARRPVVVIITTPKPIVSRL